VWLGSCSHSRFSSRCFSLDFLAISGIRADDLYNRLRQIQFDPCIKSLPDRGFRQACFLFEGECINAMFWIEGGVISLCEF